MIKPSPHSICSAVTHKNRGAGGSRFLKSISKAISGLFIRCLYAAGTIVAASICSWVQPVAAQGFEASGLFRAETTWPTYKNGKETCLTFEGNFSVMVEGCRSVVRYETTNAVYRLPEFESVRADAGATLASDGTNYYQLRLVNTSYPNSAKIIPAAKIWSGPVPERAEDKLATLWLAFASQCYFGNADSNMIYSPFMGSATDRGVWTKDHRVRAAWSKMEGPPGLPLSVVHSSEFVFATGENAPAISNLVYSVTSVTNFDGKTFPLSFECRNYFPPGVLLSSFSGQLTAIKSKVSLPDIVPPLPGVSFVKDERFITRDGNPVPEYIHKSTNWPTIEEGERRLKTLAGQKQPGSSLTVATQAKLPRTIVLSLLVLLTLVPLTLLTINRIKQKRVRADQRNISRLFQAVR